MKQGWEQVRPLADLLGGLSVFLSCCAKAQDMFCLGDFLPSLRTPPFSPSQGLPQNLRGQLPQSLALLHLTKLGLFFLLQVKL